MVMQLTEADHAQGQRGDRRGRGEQQWRDRRGRDADQRSLSRRRAALGGSRSDRWCSPGRRGGRTALHWWYDCLLGGWHAEPTLGELLTFLMVLAVLKFTAALLILKWMPLRLALTPAATKHRRVRRRAIAVFKAAAERRTVGRTGILIYLSMAERRAEIVADEAITEGHRRPTPGARRWRRCWPRCSEGRPGDGIFAAIERVGAVLAEHFPRSATDTNEIPDKLIEL